MKAINGASGRLNWLHSAASGVLLLFTFLPEYFWLPAEYHIHPALKPLFFIAEEALGRLLRR
jgi:hypothetical protein